MSEWFVSGLIIDVILCLVALEALALFFHHRLTGRGLSPGRVLPTIFAGSALLVAVRMALADAWWGWMAAALAVALVAHLFDLGVRFSG